MTFEMYRKYIHVMIENLEREYGASAVFSVTQHLAKADEELRKANALVDGRNRR